MRSTRAAILALCVLQTAAASAAEQDPPAPLHHARPKTAKAPAKTVPQARPAVTPMFEDRDRPETAAERAASLERRRKAFFATPSVETGAPSANAPGGVTLGGSNGLTPSMGLKF